MSVSARWQARLLKNWYHGGSLVYALMPVAWLYRLGLLLRRWAYQLGFAASYRAPVPVIVVGNVLVGGAGKTPTVLALARHCLEQGWQVGIVSRGYGRQGQDCQEVKANSSAAQVGDEPLLLRQRSGVPVFVANDRSAAIAALLQTYPATQLVLCDDGLQHWALQRDIEVVVFDERMLGNGNLLPAGPLREAWPRTPWRTPSPKGVPRSTANQPSATQLVLYAQAAPPLAADTQAFCVARSLSDQARRSDGRVVALHELQGHGVHAVAGIAKPEQFFAMLENLGLQLVHAEALPDHYSFDSWKDPTAKDCALVCTEKDAVKLWRRAPHALAIPLQLQIDPAFFAAFDNVLRPLLGAAAQQR